MHVVVYINKKPFMSIADRKNEKNKYQYIRQDTSNECLADLIYWFGSDISYCNGRPKIEAEKEGDESLLFQRYYGGPLLDHAEPAPLAVGLVAAVGSVRLLVLVVHGIPEYKLQKKP